MTIPIILIVIMCLLQTTGVFANSWDRVHIGVYINNDGDARVTENINTTATDGTEFYYSFVENEVTYSDFRVTQEGMELEYVKNWDLDASLEEKAGKWGFNYTGSGKYELCFGKSHMGESRYTISYKVSPLVRHYADDKYGFNHNFYESNFDDTLFSLNIRLAGDNNMEHNEDFGNKLEDNDSIWAFGFNGNITFLSDGVVIPETKLSKGDNVIIMMQLKGEHGIEAVSSNKTFDEVKKVAFVNSNYDKAADTFAYILIAVYILFIIVLAIKARSFFLGMFFLVWGVSFFGEGVISLFNGDGDIMSIVGIVLGIVIPATMLTQGIKKQKHNKKWKTFIDTIEYFRDCPKDLSVAYSIVEPNKEVLGIRNANIIGAYIMEMIKDNSLDVASEEKVKLFGRVETNDYITFEKQPTDELKLRLYNILQEAAGSNSLLEADELTRYAGTESGYNKINSFFTTCQAQGKKYLKDDDQLIKLDTYNLESYTEKGLDKLKELIGLQKYFKDFTLLDEREIKEVHNWGEMLVYATFLDVAKTVMERLKIVIPEFNKEASEYGKLYRGTYISDYFGRSTLNGFRMRQAQIEQARRTSGGGGSSSFGGGGGFSGGGHGGGSR